MNRIKETFNRLYLKKQKALVVYLMVGYPDYETSLKAFNTVLENGADILEIGFPFSDPVADGPTIQIAHEVALNNGIKSHHVFEAVKTLRRDFPHIPFLLMTYYNPVFRIGQESFCCLAKESGLDGFIVPDLPPEECVPLKETMKNYGLSLILLASPTSTEKRLRLICEKTDDMVYFVSVTGTTGERKDLPFKELKDKVHHYRKICSKPVVVGFGVSTKAHVREISCFADGVVVGSSIVKLSSQKNMKKLADKVKELKEGTLKSGVLS